MLNNITGNPSSILNGAGGLSATAGGGASDSIEDIYKVEVNNWYKTLPYGFVFHDRATSDTILRSSTFYLPISPNNIQVTTQFATNVVTTLYGVVEEHSAVRYYDMTISGTTGIAPKYVGEKKEQQSNDSVGSLTDQTGSSESAGSFMSTGRSAFDGNIIPDLGGFFPEVTNVISQVVDTVSELASSFTGGVPDSTGIEPSKTGYAAFHNFYRFLMKYKKDAAGVGKLGNQPRKSAHSLQFLNYKDKIKYDCVPQSFTLVRNADNPMLYNYSIKMRCYNLRNIEAEAPEVNQLDKLGLLGPNSTIEGNSLFSNLSSVASNTATLVSGFL